jgi:hypothetical protein
MYDRAISNITNSDIDKKFPNTALNVTLR